MYGWLLYPMSDRESTDGLKLLTEVSMMITNESHYDNDVRLLYNTSLQTPVLQRTLQSSTKLVTVYQFSGHLHLTQED